jgi:hypothetical protein
MRPAIVMLALLMVTGCKAVPQIAGVVTGGTVGVASGSPALGFAAGIATDAAASAGMRYIVVVRQRAEQDAVAQVAGGLGLGEKAAWRIDHTIPIGNEQGELEVVRVIDTPLATCKEIAFSVDEGSGKDLKRAWFVTSVCKQDSKWKWAGAEPAVERWGYLQ